MCNPSHVSVRNAYLVLCSVLIVCNIASCSASRLSEICQDADLPPSSASESWIGSFFPTAPASNISDQCVGDTQHYIEALCDRTMWAIKSKFPFAVSSVSLAVSLRRRYGAYKENKRLLLYLLSRTLSMDVLKAKVCVNHFASSECNTVY